MKIPKLEDNNKKAKKLGANRLLKSWKNIEEVFHN